MLVWLGTLELLDAGGWIWVTVALCEDCDEDEEEDCELMTIGEADRPLWWLSGWVCELDCSCLNGVRFRLLLRGLRLSNFLTSIPVFLKSSKIVCSRSCRCFFVDPDCAREGRPAS